MKNAFLLGALLLGLTACGGGGTVTPPNTSYPYNPNANAVEQNDARIPYRGDWVFVANLSDGSKRYGVVSVTDKSTGAGLANAGGGLAAWCLTTTCAQDDEQGIGIIGSVATSAGAQLSVGMVPKGATNPRFVMTDADGVVSQTSDGRATISGQGFWTNAAGVDLGASFGFVQVNTKSDLATQRLAAQAILSAQSVAGRPSVSAGQAVTLREARTVLGGALIK